jgi:hypothetical protein
MYCVGAMGDERRQDMNWLSDQVTQAAQSVELAGGTVRGFRQEVAERFAQSPITEWETLFWTRGIKRGLIHLNSHWFRLGSGRQASFSLFVRNETGLIVGLRREAITQAAVYTALVTHYGYQRRHVRFELDYLDVALQDAEGRVTLYAETKASDRVLERLVADLSTDFKEGLPFLELPEGKKPPDAFQKAAHILRNRPQHFWAVSPHHRLSFDVHYLGIGFRLTPVSDIPFHRDADLFSFVETAST